MNRILLAFMLAFGIPAAAQLQLGSGTSMSPVSTPAPWSNYYQFSYTQQIIKKSELNTSAGNITGLRFYLAPSKTLLNADQVVVYMGHTSNNEFASTSSWVPISALTQMFSGVVTNNGGVVEINFTTPFAYNNADNLIIAIDENKSGYDNVGSSSSEYFYKYDTGSNTTLSYRNDSTNPDPASPPTTGSASHLSRSQARSVMQILGLTPSVVPACSTVTEPAASAVNVPVTPTFTWAAASGATSYALSLGTSPGGREIMNNVNVGLVTGYTVPAVSPLAYFTDYYFTVSAVNQAGTATGCTETVFKTINIPCPSVSAPSSSAAGVGLSPTFSWSASPAATGYRISIGTTAGGTDVLDNVDVGNVTSYTLNSILNYGTKYYYTINSYNATLSSSGCTERSFTTVTLCPQLTAPLSASNNVSITPTFGWTPVQGATGYTLSVGTVPGGVDVLNNVNVGNVTGYTLPVPLAFSTKYYFTVSGHNATQSSSGCSERSFTTQGPCPFITYPADGANLQPVQPVIKWNAIATASYYTLTVGTTAGASDIMNNVNVGNSTSYTFPTPLSLGVKYYYKVNSNTSVACTERTFRVNSAAAPANDDCSGALEATSFPYHYSQTNGAGSTNGAGFVTACSTGSNDGLWFKFLGDGTSVTVKATSTSAWDHKVSVYSGTCGSLTCVGTADEGSGSVGTVEAYTFNSVPGAPYFVNVAYFSESTDGSEGNFDLSISSMGVLETVDLPRAKTKEITLYPIPFKDELNITEAAYIRSVAVIDGAGRVVKIVKNPSQILRLGDLKQGGYLIQIDLKDGTRQTIKAIKK
ncbi:hypothetical protein VUJ46_22390 [Chryseobacterium sp. MYb264]|uniref:hypothetical protein n=1 Tax=Chryseobacterium sp. MYb264 TaxID=2745153 RepID=UPI002E10A3C7|nr:hypothetical protein VUJ46_22390 [Chryseobacterium sp. MYb264]